MPYDIIRVLTSVHLIISSRFKTSWNIFTDAPLEVDESERWRFELFKVVFIDGSFVPGCKLLSLFLSHKTIETRGYLIKDRVILSFIIKM